MRLPIGDVRLANPPAAPALTLNRDNGVNRELAERLAGVNLAYPPSASGHLLDGRRMPDLALADAPVSNVFGLLRQARFVLLDMAGGQLAERFAGFAPALDIACASAMNTAARPGWQGVEAVLLRPDGHIGWVGPDDSTESAASLLRALAGWLDAMPTTWFGSGADCQSGGLPSMT